MIYVLSLLLSAIYIPIFDYGIYILDGVVLITQNNSIFDEETKFTPGGVTIMASR